MMILVFKSVLALFAIVVLLGFLRAVLFKTGLIFIAKKWWRCVEDCFHVYQSFKVPEFNAETMQENQLYRKVLAYLNSLTSMEESDFTNLFTGKKPNDIVLRLDPNQVVEDDFLGARVLWINKDPTEGGEGYDCRCFVLKVRKADKRRILRPYLQHIHTVADELEPRKRELRLYINVQNDDGLDHPSGAGRRWRSIPFTHPSTFDTVAMEEDLKAKVKFDLDSFLKAKHYYHRLGRVWKRSYLLYGPSGTGKSSFVAAMANYLGYDLYDVDLSKVKDDADLKFLLLQTTGKSIIVIDDLDRFLGSRQMCVTLPGVLDFMDGILNSCCAEERLMVFTMNSKDHIEPALLRPGRIDVHIHFPLCDFSAFKNLANSYLGVKDHKLFPQVEEIFQSGASLSPAEIGELMIANRNSPSRAIKSVISALHTEGEGRGSGQTARRYFDGAARRSVEEVDEPDGVFCKDAVPSPKEFRKLYSLLRMKSSRKTHSFDMGNAPRDG